MAELNEKEQSGASKAVLEKTEKATKETIKRAKITNEAGEKFVAELKSTADSIQKNFLELTQKMKEDESFGIEKIAQLETAIDAVTVTVKHIVEESLYEISDEMMDSRKHIEKLFDTLSASGRLSTGSIFEDLKRGHYYAGNIPINLGSVLLSWLLFSNSNTVYETKPREAFELSKLFEFKGKRHFYGNYKQHVLKKDEEIDLYKEGILFAARIVTDNIKYIDITSIKTKEDKGILTLKNTEESELLIFGGEKLHSSMGLDIFAVGKALLGIFLMSINMPAASLYAVIINQIIRIVSPELSNLTNPFEEKETIE